MPVSSLLCNLVLLLSLQKTPLHKDNMFGMEAGFQCFCGDLRIFCFNLERRQILSFLRSDEAVQSRSPHILHTAGLKHVNHLLQ